MSISTNFTFPHDYTVDTEVWLPPGPGSIKRYYYPGASERGGHDGALLEVTPANGPAWLGMFAVCHDGCVYSCPDGKSLCVVASGGGYIVKADDPLQWVEIPLMWVEEVRVLSEQRLLVFRDWTNLLAYGPDGLAWETERIAMDKLTIEAVEGYILRGRAVVPGSASDDDHVKWVDYEVDLRTGRHTGGWQDM